MNENTREDEDGDTESKKGVSIVFKLSNPIQSNFTTGIQQSSGDGVYRWQGTMIPYPVPVPFVTPNSNSSDANIYVRL